MIIVPLSRKKEILVLGTGARQPTPRQQKIERRPTATISIGERKQKFSNMVTPIFHLQKELTVHLVHCCGVVERTGGTDALVFLPRRFYIRSSVGSRVALGMRRVFLGVFIGRNFAKPARPNDIARESFFFPAAPLSLSSQRLLTRLRSDCSSNPEAGVYSIDVGYIHHESRPHKHLSMSLEFYLCVKEIVTLSCKSF